MDQGKDMPRLDASVEELRILFQSTLDEAGLWESDEKWRYLEESHGSVSAEDMCPPDAAKQALLIRMTCGKKISPDDILQVSFLPSMSDSWAFAADGFYYHVGKKKGFIPYAAIAEADSDTVHYGDVARNIRIRQKWDASGNPTNQWTEIPYLGDDLDGFVDGVAKFLNSVASLVEE